MKRFLLVSSIAVFMLIAFDMGNAFASNIITPTEPPTLLLVGFGLIGLFMIGRRTKRK